MTVGPSRAARAAAPGLSELIGSTDAGLLLVHDAGPERVETVVLHEPDAQHRIPRQSLVLAVGYPGDSSAFETLVAAAAAAHAVAVVAKPSTAGPDALRHLGEQHGVSTILAEQSADWLTVASMLRSAAAVSVVDAVAGIRVGDLFGFANAVALATGGATAIVDPAGRLVGFSNLGDQPLDELRRRTTLLMSEQDSPARDPDYRRLYAADTCVHLPGGPGMFDRLAVAVRSDGEILGSLWVLIPPGPRSEEANRAHAERALLELTESAALHLHHARAELDVQRSRNTALLQSLLHGDDRASGAAAALGLQDRGWFRLAVLVPDPSAMSQTSRQQVHSVSNWLQIVHRNALFAEINSQLVILFSGTRGDEWPLVERSLDTFFRNSDAVRATILVATSGATVRPRDLSTEFGRLSTLARITARRHRAAPGASPVIRMEDHWPDVELTTIAQRYAGNDAGRLSVLDDIRAHDRAHHTEYWPTLCAYVRCDRNYGAAAAELNLHANTVRYRIERLHTLFSLDLARPTTFLWTAIQVHAVSAH